jgi:predicted permease
MTYQFLLSMSVIVIGYIIKRLKIVSISDGQGIARAILNVTLPALVINTFSTIKVDFSLGLLPILNIIYGLIITVIAIFAFRNEKGKMRGALSMLIPGFNIGLFAYPLVETLWGIDALKYFAMFDMGNAIILFGVCYAIGCWFSVEGAKVDFKYIAKKLLTFFPLIAYMTTLAFNLLGIQFPAFILDLSKILAKANAPMSLLVLGIYLDFSLDASYLKKILKALAIRYGFGLAFGFTLFLLLPFGEMFQNTMLIGFILPVGLAVIPYSAQFEYDSKLIGSIINLTNVISFALIYIIGVTIRS